MKSRRISIKKKTVEIVLTNISAQGRNQGGLREMKPLPFSQNKVEKKDEQF